MQQNLLNLNLGAIQDYFIGLGEKSFHGRQVFKWMHQQGVTSFSEMTDISKNLRSQLDLCASIKPPEIAAEEISSDGTYKWSLRLGDGNSIETVFIPEEDRGTLCISSQAGCVLNCTFCSTARQGFNRNLDVHEIIGQLFIANRELGKISKYKGSKKRIITNVVMMGMGEPLLNFDNVVQAIEIMQDDLGYGLSKRRITLSTSGVVPMIDNLRIANPVSLAVSLHAPNDQLRDQLVPLNKKYPIKDLMEACKRYVDGEPRRRVTIEYVMLKGVNDSAQQARQLIKVLAGVPVKINLIPFNSFSDSGYEKSDTESINNFRGILMKAGIITVTRKTRGDDINAACGQLAGDITDRTKRSKRQVSIAVNQS